MRSSIVIDQAVKGSCRSLSWPRHYAGLSILVVMTILFARSDLAFAQYPGFSSDADPASVSADAEDAPSEGIGNESGTTIGNDALASSSADAGVGSIVSGNLSGDGDNNSQTTSNGFLGRQIGPRHGKAVKIILCASFVSNLQRWNLSSAEPAGRFRAMMCHAILMSWAPNLPRCEDQQARHCGALRMMFSILIPN